MEAVRLRISGRVQGVGYRAFVMREAERLGLSGWVRNRSDGTVEALASGDGEALRQLIEACRRGPRFAVVTAVTAEPEAPGAAMAGSPAAGFTQLPTA